MNDHAKTVDQDKADKQLADMLARLAWRLAKGRRGYIMLPFNFDKQTVEPARLHRIRMGINRRLRSEHPAILIVELTQDANVFTLQVAHNV